MRRRQEPLDRIAAQYAGYVARGIVLQVRNGEIEISTPEGTVNEALRRQVERDKAALIEYIAKLPPKSWFDVGRKDDFDEANELAF
jgi:predicted metal-dependent hydrolase